MSHHFEVSEGGSETLLLVYPPAVIRELAEILVSAERLHGPLPTMMQTPIYGTYTFTASRENSDDDASEEKPSRAA